MKLFNFYVSLRKELLEQISGVNDAYMWSAWNDKSPNWLTKKNISILFEKYLDIAKSYGIYTITRHSSCGNSLHKKHYYISNEAGLKLDYPSEKYELGGPQLFQGEKNTICPCSNISTTHHIIIDVVYFKNSRINDPKKLCEIFSHIHDAIDSCSDRKPRAAIRENLLAAVLKINDQLLPQSVDQYIKHITQMYDN